MQEDYFFILNLYLSYKRYFIICVGVDVCVLCVHVGEIQHLYVISTLTSMSLMKSDYLSHIFQDSLNK